MFQETHLGGGKHEISKTVPAKQQESSSGNHTGKFKIKNNSR